MFNTQRRQQRDTIDTTTLYQARNLEKDQLMLNLRWRDGRRLLIHVAPP